MSVLLYNSKTLTDFEMENFGLVNPISMAHYFRYANPGLVMEFGVSYGGTLRTIMNSTDAVIYAFDSFEGLPEDWVSEDGTLIHLKGAFKANVPTVLPGGDVELVVGLFQDTLPNFLEKHPGPISFIHLDCDLYSSHKFVLDHVRDRLDGTILVFDDLLAFEHNRHHGFKAFKEFFHETNYEISYIGHHNPPPGAGFLLKQMR